MRNCLLAFVLMLVIGLANAPAGSTAGASVVSSVDNTDTSSCADFAQLPVVEIVLAPSLPPGESISTLELVSLRETIEHRLIALGAFSAIVQIDASQSIVIDLFLTDRLLNEDVDRIIGIVKTTGVLEIVDPRGQYLPQGSSIRSSRDPGGMNGASEATAEPIYATILSDSDFQEFFRTKNGIGQYVIGFRLSEDGANKLYAFTSTHIGQPMSIVIDKYVYATPRIDAAISSEGIISGIASSEIADLLVILRSGPLSVPVTLISSSDSSSLCSG